MANCSIFWDNFQGDIPDSLVHFFIFYCYAVCVFGTLCNVVTLWCVLGCPRTSRPVKLLLCALFFTTLLMCLVVMPFMAQVGISKVHCDREIPLNVIRVIITLYIILTAMELLYIAGMAFLRAVAVWSSTKRQVKMRTSVALVIGSFIYCTVTTLLLRVIYWLNLFKGNIWEVLVPIYNAVHFLAPVVFTIACYLSMILVVRRNKRRLAATPDTTVTGKVMDQATRAMLAVFISNLLLGLPHSIYHAVLFEARAFNYVIVHIVFFTHMFVDPLAFVCSNLHHRQHVLHTLKSCMGWVCCRSPSTLPQATSTLPLHVSPSSSSSTSEQQQEQA